MQSLVSPLQKPLGTGFGPSTTACEALGGARLEGRVAIVTGGYAGVGLETTRTLVAAGATVIVPARSPQKAHAALSGLARVELESLDLAEPATVEDFAARFLASGRALHLLINNAGIMAAPLSRDARGFEAHFATNHLGHFQLTARLWPALLRAAGARVVSLTSRGHARSGVDFDDPNFERRPYDKWLAYGQSKTANALFAIGLDRRGAPHGVRAFSVHPGSIATDLMRFMTEEEGKAILERATSVGPMKNVEQGAATSIWCATSPRLADTGGVYCEDVDIAEPVSADDATRVTGVRPWATDPHFAEQLWERSEVWTGARLSP
ncbi:MAG TPA: oxidoreductase [Polyangiaceae bacterium]|nr:oxidoreductase [Polyangiaceae bacterium]